MTDPITRREVGPFWLGFLEGFTAPPKLAWRIGCAIWRVLADEVRRG